MATRLLIALVIALVGTVLFVPVYQGHVSEGPTTNGAEAHDVRPDRNIYLPMVATGRPTLPADLQRGVNFLVAQYNPSVGLIRESPVTAPHTYWLATDNRLALYALQAAGVVTPTETISDTLQSYGDPRHGLIEVLQGQVVPWPPYTETQRLIAAVGTEQVWLETRLDGNTYTNWEEYADLALFGALHAFYAAQRVETRQIYQGAMQMWDGVGFADKAYREDGLYATYKLALALYVGRAIGEPRNPAILNALLAMQAPSNAICDGQPCAGGFYALYDKGGTPVGDTNAETTAYAVLGLLR